MAKKITLNHDRWSDVKPVSSSPFTAEFKGNATELQDLLDHFGPQVNIATVLGVSPSTLCQWGKRMVPLDVAFAVEYHTNGLLQVPFDAIAKRYDPYYRVRRVA